MNVLVSFLETQDYGSLTAADEVIDYGLITDPADSVDYGSVAVSAFYSPQETSTELGSINATGGTGADISVSGLDASSEIGNLSYSASANISLSGIEATSQAAIIGANGGVRFEIAGLQVESQQGSISLVYDYLLSVDGIQTSSQIGNVSASGGSQNIPTAAGGEVHLRPISVRDAKVKLKTLKGLFSAGYISARGQTVVNNLIRLKSVSGNIQTNVVKATGILDISDDEIIILLAA